MTNISNLNRRRFLGTTVAATGMALAAPHIARAAGYPEGNINVYVPTSEGGGADRNFRAFSSIWKENWAPISSLDFIRVRQAASATKSTWVKPSLIATI